MEQLENEDMISNLPDAIIHLILSCIPTKCVIIASSLSKKWKEISLDHLTYAQNLDFGVEFAKGKTPDQFTEDLNRVLSLNRFEKINRFKLVFSPRNERHRSNAVNWIQFASSKSVKEIDLDFCRQIHVHFLSTTHVVGGSEAFELPRFLYDCRTPISLKLSRCIMTVPEIYTGFGSLVAIYLKQVHVTDNMLERLLQNCKQLEVLVLKECGSLNKIRILSSVKLRKLTVYECKNASIFELSGRNIRSMLISAGHLDSCKLQNLPMLEEVFIGTRGDEFGGVLCIFIKVLSDLAHVRCLTLYLGHLVPNLLKDLQVNFSNLQELQLVNSPLFGLFNSDVYCFFRHCSCPSLRHVTIELSTVEDENFNCEYRKPNVPPIKCVLNNLKAVTLRNFRGNDADIELATFFLERATILEAMLLITLQNQYASSSTSKVSDHDTLNEMQKSTYARLRCHPKASPVAEIRVIENIEHHHLLSILKRHQVIDVYTGK